MQTHTARSVVARPVSRHPAFLHLGCLRRIPFVPDLDRLPHFKYLALALLHSVTELPSFDRLTKLEQLLNVDATHFVTVPSVAGLPSLKAIVIVGRNAVCCNGVCGLSAYSCRDRTLTGEARIDCVPERLSTSDHARIDAVDVVFCAPSLPLELIYVGPTRASSDDAYGDVLYKQCEVGGAHGIYYGTRMMVIECDLDPSYEALRRLQIARGVGAPCDPLVEAWLGANARPGIRRCPQNTASSGLELDRPKSNRNEGSISAHLEETCRESIRNAALYLEEPNL